MLRVDDKIKFFYGDAWHYGYVTENSDALRGVTRVFFIGYLPNGLYATDLLVVANGETA